MAITSTVIALILFIDAIISVVKIKNIQSTLKKIEELNKQIKEKLLEIKEKEKTSANESIQTLVCKLKDKRNKILRNLYRRTYRLKKAFPAIDTKEFSEILNKKSEIKHKKLRKRKKGE